MFFLTEVELHITQPVASGATPAPHRAIQCVGDFGIAVQLDSDDLGDEAVSLVPCKLELTTAEVMRDVGVDGILEGFCPTRGAERHNIVETAGQAAGRHDIVV